MSDINENRQQQMETPAEAGPDTPSTMETLRELVREPDRWALFLDIDGTLLDLALTPDAVGVPQELPPLLNTLSTSMGGALALVTGRSLAFADRLFAPFRFPIAGLHGAEVRGGDGVEIPAHATPEFEALKQALSHEIDAMPGVLMEDKGAAVAAHYRLAPGYEQSLGERMRQYAERAGPGWALQLGKMVFEIRPARSSKGDAVQLFMGQAPFAGRIPVAFGDDLTDESMFAVVNARGGRSIRVGTLAAPTCAMSRAPSAAYVREAIAAIVSGGPLPAMPT